MFLKAIGVMKMELWGTKNMLKAVVFQTVLAKICTQIESRIESGVINFANVFVIGIIVFIFSLILISKVKHKNSKCSCCPYSKICGK